MISKTSRVKYTIINEAAGISFGRNHWDLIDPGEATILAHVIGKAGVNLTQYAAFFGRNFDDELTVRSMSIDNHDEIYFVRRELLGLRNELLPENFSIPYWNPRNIK